jgi:uncharacterized protein YecE (DUF72 family)
MPVQCELRIGTSGWHYKQWLGDFYPARFPAAQMLQWYAQEFDTVEINNTFYRLPQDKTFQQWRHRVPPGFLFAVKASRFITHIKRLKDPEDSIRLLFERAAPLGRLLGPILFQLPPKWKADLDRLEGLLSVLPKQHRYAFEFRDESWAKDSVYAVLRRYNAALCINDWHQEGWPMELTADFTYIRFHGTGGRYSGNYPDLVLQDWAQRIRGWQKRLTSVFAYFNNDVEGHAIRNARSLRAMLQPKSASRTKLQSAA